MASPATNLPSRVVLTIETDPAGLDPKALVERYQKFFDFYHPAYNVKVKFHAAVQSADQTQPSSPGIPLPSPAGPEFSSSVLD